MKVNFYDEADDKLLKFVVIISKYQGKWIFCKHKERTTYECPGGHREDGENILDAAKRELYEETGAIKFDIKPICVYSVVGKDKLSEDDESYGMLYYAEVTELESELHSEIEKIELFDDLPSDWTYPLIQPLLFEECQRRLQL